MSKEFNPDNSHQENVKVAIDKIIGEPTNIKKRKKSEQEQKRILFKKIIESIIEAEQKNTLLHEMFSIDLSAYNTVFFDVIDNLIKFTFNKDQIKAINFYLYDRYSADGSMLELRDDQDNSIKLDTPEDLWFLLKSMDNGSKQ